MLWKYLEQNKRFGGQHRCSDQSHEIIFPDVVLSVTYSRHSEGIVSIDLDNTIMTYSLAPNIFGRGNVVMEAGGPIWVNRSSHRLLVIWA